MSSYFDEFNFTPLADGDGPDHQLHLARFLLDSGIVHDTDWDFVFPNGKPPPASKSYVESLTPIDFSDAREEFKTQQCPICILAYQQDEKICRLPKCHHHFHYNCLMPWLKQTSTCPMCRDPLPTDDQSYENMKKFKKTREEMKNEIDNLHHRMYN